MLDFKESTVVTVLNATQLGSIESGCPTTVILWIVDEFGTKGKIFLHNNQHQAPLISGTRIVVQEQKNPENNMAREYRVWRNVPAYIATQQQNTL